MLHQYRLLIHYFAERRTIADELISVDYLFPANPTKQFKSIWKKGLDKFEEKTDFLEVFRGNELT